MGGISQLNYFYMRIVIQVLYLSRFPSPPSHRGVLHALRHARRDGGGAVRGAHGGPAGGHGPARRPAPPAGAGRGQGTLQGRLRAGDLRDGVGRCQQSQV